MFKHAIDTSSYEADFIRKALFEDLRLDSRKLHTSRDMEVSITRDDNITTSESVLGGTRVLCIIEGSVVSPYMDRSSEGILQINTDLSIYSDQLGVSNNELRRFIERSIRESDAMDMESLCIISGEFVWKINCDIKILDYSGGNIIDCAIFGTMAALRAYRKSEVTTIIGMEENVTTMTTRNSNRSKVHIHSSMEREPLPLALHHTPLSMTIALFKLDSQENEEQIMTDSPCLLRNSMNGRMVALVCDPSLEEERSSDGKIVITMTGHNELCAIHKPGGLPLSVEVILKATKLASDRTQRLHKIIQTSLIELEERVSLEREQVVERYRQYKNYVLAMEITSHSMIDHEDIQKSSNSMDDRNGTEIGIGIDKNDPMLAWSNLHKPAQLPSSSSSLP